MICVSHPGMQKISRKYCIHIMILDFGTIQNNRRTFFLKMIITQRSKGRFVLLEYFLNPSTQPLPVKFG